MKKQFKLILEILFYLNNWNSAITKYFKTISRQILFININGLWSRKQFSYYYWQGEKSNNENISDITLISTINQKDYS